MSEVSYPSCISSQENIEHYKVSPFAMMEQNILLSVIVPIYNREDYLRRCIDSIICQTYHNLQIILIDDGSTDSSGLICDEYQEQDDRIIVIHQENKGVVASRKIGLALASGEYIGFVDSDDWIDKSMYWELIKKVQKTQADRVFCDFFCDNEGKRTEKKINFYPTPNRMLESLLSNENPVVIWNGIIKTDLARFAFAASIGKASSGEDLLANVVSLSINPILAAVSKTLYYYNVNVHPSFVSSGNKNILYEAKENIYAVYEFLVAKGTIKDYLPTMFFTPLRVKISLLNDGKIDEAIDLYPHVNKEKKLYIFLPMYIRWIYWALFNWGKLGKLVYNSYIYAKQFVKQ